MPGQASEAVGRLDGARTDGSPARSRRRQALIQAAGELFSDRPFDAVTVEEVCARAGVTGPALYRHFSSKQELLIAVLEDPLERLLDFARRVAAEESDPRRALEQMVAFHSRLVLEGVAATLVFAKHEYSVPDDERRRLRRMMRLYVEEWAEVIGTLRPDLSDGQARVVAHGLFGLLNSMATFNSGLDADTLRRTVSTLALSAVLSGRDDDGAPLPAASSPADPTPLA
jgi:AcrR family transcriptional regulator